MSLERIEITPFAVIAGNLFQERRTGHLTIIQAPIRRVLYWSQGELVLITSASPEDSLGDFLVRRGAIGSDRAAQISSGDPATAVSRFHEAGGLDLSARQTLLREWISSLFIPLFSLDEGTAAFTDDSGATDGLSVADGPYKVVFLAFPFEAYGSAAQRADLMNRALTWFAS